MIEQFIKNIINCSEVIEQETIQELWSGYGKIRRFKTEGSNIESIIVKNIKLSSIYSHPRGWNTNISHQRKLKSYNVETEWYQNWSSKVNTRIPKCYGIEIIGQEYFIFLEDLDKVGFSIRKSGLTLNELKPCIKWLAQFHSQFINTKPNNLWEKGTYWNLETRLDEFNRMEEGFLKENAYKIDSILNNCSFKTILHGDAKVANFCFNKNGEVAAVDFQYVGGGCGMKDLIYLIGSALSSDECFKNEEAILEYYFNFLNNNEVEKEWRPMYSLAWADFNRFLLGWSPGHPKIDKYSDKMVENIKINTQN